MLVVFAARIRRAAALRRREPLRYAFSFWGVVDLLVVTARHRPAHAAMAGGARRCRLVRLLKLFRSSRALDRLVLAMRAVRGELLIFGVHRRP